MRKRGTGTIPAGKKENDSRSRAHAHRLREILAVLVRHEVFRGVTPLRLRLILEDLGPTFVKIGQILSMRADLLPEEFLAELAKLRDSVRPMPFPEVREVLQEAYGRPLDDVFSSFEQQPIGAASIAQVHEAVLKDSSQVVVKVQRAGIHEKMRQDMALLRKAAGLVKLTGAAGNAVDFRTVLDEMWFVTQQEMDFLAEAENLETFAAFHREVAFVGCPRMYPAYTTSRVLVMENVRGTPILRREELEKQGYDLKEIAEKLCRDYVKQVLADGFFHADPHPGNLCIREGKIIFLDLGMVGRLTPREQGLIRRGAQGIAFRDVQEAKTALLSLAVHSQPIDHARLYEDIEMVMDRYGQMEIGQMNLGRLLTEVLSVANRHGLGVPEGMAMLSRCMLTLQGVVGHLSPEVNIVTILAQSLKESALKDIDWQKEVMQEARALYRSGKKALELPYQLSELLQTSIKGQAKINLELTGSEKPLMAVKRMVNRLILCMLCCALMVAAALMCQLTAPALLAGLPWPSFLGFAGASALGVYLVFIIWKDRK